MRSRVVYVSTYTYYMRRHDPGDEFIEGERLKAVEDGNPLRVVDVHMLHVLHVCINVYIYTR